MTDEQITLTFFKGRDGKTIARTNEGKICLLDITYCKQNHIWINPGEDWRCGIKEDRQNVMIVQPITRTLTAEENEKMFDIKAKEFKEQGFHQRTPRLSAPSLVKKDKKTAPAEGNLKPSKEPGPGQKRKSEKQR